MVTLVNVVSPYSQAINAVTRVEKRLYRMMLAAFSAQTYFCSGLFLLASGLRWLKMLKNGLLVLCSVNVAI